MSMANSCIMRLTKFLIVLQRYAKREGDTQRDIVSELERERERVRLSVYLAYVMQFV